MNDDDYEKYESFADTLDNENQKPEKEVETEPVLEPFSKLDLEKLKSERSEYISSLDLTIGGEIEKTVHTSLDQQKEDKVAYMEQTLDNLKNRARDDFNKTQQFADMQEIERDDGISR